jgi:hypothetical protein
MSDLVEEETKSQESLAQRHHDELISVLVRIADALDALEVELCRGVRGDQRGPGSDAGRWAMSENPWNGECHYLCSESHHAPVFLCNPLPKRRWWRRLWRRFR